jgi:hypothetical protein
MAQKATAEEAMAGITPPPAMGVATAAIPVAGRTVRRVLAEAVVDILAAEAAGIIKPFV